jgi:hypothetical protein
MDNYRRSRSLNFRFTILAAGVLVACAAGGVTVRMSEARSHSRDIACLSVGPGVCMSGNADWLMQSARTPGQIHTESLPVVIAEAQ